jgi:hypothetical protein
MADCMTCHDLRERPRHLLNSSYHDLKAAASAGCQLCDVVREVCEIAYEDTIHPFMYMYVRMDIVNGRPTLKLDDDTEGMYSHSDFNLVTTFRTAFVRLS